MGRGEWGGDNEERGLQEHIDKRTHGPNQGGGWRWGREGGFRWGGGMGRKGTQL